MRLDRALDLGAKETIAFVGAGGKTTLMFRLAADLAAMVVYRFRLKMCTALAPCGISPVFA